mmetsp:Transcript_73821/g.213854  ORF Transcript_73821/g.213854 Transcript_73821/m.213854 type:complete len:230 (-) Transcript_73821:108-797(-)
MSEVEHTVPRQGHRGRGAAQGTVEVILRLGLRAPDMGCHEGGGQCLHGVVAEGRILDEQPRQCVLHKIRDVMAVWAMPIEHPVDADGIGTEHAEVVLIRAFRLQALLASVADPGARQSALAAVDHKLVHEALLLVSFRNGSARHGDPPLGAWEQVQYVAVEGRGRLGVVLPAHVDDRRNRRSRRLLDLLGLLLRLPVHDLRMELRALERATAHGCHRARRPVSHRASTP